MDTASAPGEHIGFVGPTSPRRVVQRRLAGKSPGQALIMVTVMFMVLIGFVALATDTGLIWVNRRSLQNAADAAALAGVQQLPNDVVGAESVACDYGTVKNAITGMTGKSGDCSGKADVVISQKYVANDKITVTTYKTINPIFGLAVGFASIEIGASATAVVGSIASACPFPIFQTPEMLPGVSAGSMAFYQLTAMHLQGADNQAGNFLTLDVGSGAPAVLDAMVNNTCGAPIGSTADTEPGAKINKVVDGFQWRVYCAGGGGTQPGSTPACAPGASACPSADIAPYLVQSASGMYELSPALTRANCPRLVVVPILEGPIDAVNGKTGMKVLGFGVYYISGVCPPTGQAQTCAHPTLGTLQKGDSWGYFVRMTGTSTDYSGYNGYGTKVAALID